MGPDNQKRNMRVLGTVSILFGLYKSAWMILFYLMMPSLALCELTGFIYVTVGIFLLFQNRSAVLWGRSFAIFSLCKTLIVAGWFLWDFVENHNMFADFAFIFIFFDLLFTIIFISMLFRNYSLSELALPRKIFNMSASMIVIIASLIVADYGLTHDLFGSTVTAIVESPANPSWRMASELEVWADSTESFNVLESRWWTLEKREIFDILWDGSGRDMITCNWSKDGSLFIVSKLGQPVCAYDFTNGSLLAPDRPMPENKEPIMFVCDVAVGKKVIPSVEFDRMIASRGGRGQKIEWSHKRR